MYLSEKKNLLELLYYVVKYVLVFNLNKKKIQDGFNYEINYTHIKVINTTKTFRRNKNADYEGMFYNILRICFESFGFGLWWEKNLVVYDDSPYTCWVSLQNGPSCE